jgi:hypothetical protein
LTLPRPVVVGATLTCVDQPSQLDFPVAVVALANRIQILLPVSLAYDFHVGLYLPLVHRNRAALPCSNGAFAILVERIPSHCPEDIEAPNTIPQLYLRSAG